LAAFCLTVFFLLAFETANMSVLLETTLGDIVIDLFTDERPRGKTGDEKE